jgi:hypothetical protein
MFKRSPRGSATARRGRSAARDVSRTYRRAPPRVAHVPASAIQSRPLVSSIPMAPGGAITDFQWILSRAARTLVQGLFVDSAGLVGLDEGGADLALQREHDLVLDLLERAGQALDVALVDEESRRQGGVR